MTTICSLQALNTQSCHFYIKYFLSNNNYFFFILSGITFIYGEKQKCLLNALDTQNLRQDSPNHTDENHTERYSAKLCNCPKPDTAARRLLISSPLSARQGEHTGTCWGQKTQHVENSRTAAIRMQQCQSQDAAGIQAALYKSSPTDTCVPLPI